MKKRTRYTNEQLQKMQLPSLFLNESGSAFLVTKSPSGNLFRYTCLATSEKETKFKVGDNDYLNMIIGWTEAKKGFFVEFVQQ